MAGRIAAAVCVGALKGVVCTSSPTPIPTLFIIPTPDPTDAPTPPTPVPTVPTPAPTITPTWAPAVEAYMADWEEPCSLPLNVEECQAYASAEGYTFESRDSASLPRGCWLQYPDEYLFFNAYATWTSTAAALETWCDVTHDFFQWRCYARMVCRKEDWYLQRGSCQDGTGLNQQECERIASGHDVYAGGFVTIADETLPDGCFGMDSNVVWNPQGGHNKAYQAFCAEEAVPCAAKVDREKSHKWCKKKCHKKRKRTCHTKCPTKCLDRCRCNVKCADSDTWYFNDPVHTGVMHDGWYNERSCAWVEKDPENRCKVKGIEGERTMKAKAACPTACGKCKSARRLSSKVMIV